MGGTYEHSVRLLLLVCCETCPRLPFQRRQGALQLSDNSLLPTRLNELHGGTHLRPHTPRADMTFLHVRLFLSYCEARYLLLVGLAVVDSDALLVSQDHEAVGVGPLRVQRRSHVFVYARFYVPQRAVLVALDRDAPS